MLEPADDAWRDSHLPSWWRIIKDRDFKLQKGMSVINILFAGKHGMSIYATIIDVWSTEDRYVPGKFNDFVHVHYKGGGESKAAAIYYIPNIDDEKTKEMLGI